MNALPWQVQTIINTANQLQRDGHSGASTGERIAAAFVLNRMEFLPVSYRDVIEAWERIEDWQHHVKRIKREYTHLIEGP